MKIVLKNVAYSARLSQETTAYAADVWVDGKKAGTVRNEGMGGPDVVWPHTLHQQIAAYAATLPRRESKYGDYQPDVESVLGDAFDTWLASRDLKRALAKRYLVVKQDGKIYETCTKAARPFLDGVVHVLNDLPFDEALALYRKASR